MEIKEKKGVSPRKQVIRTFLITVVAACIGVVFGWRYFPRFIANTKSLLGLEPTPQLPICMPVDEINESIEPDTSNPQYSDIQEQPETIFLNIPDLLQFMEREPSYEDIAPDPNDDQAFLLTTLDQIFPEGLENFPQEDQVLGILRFIGSFLKSENNFGCATKIIQEGHAICGGKVISYSALSRKVGLPTRIVNMFGLVNQGGHSVIEVYYDNAWHLVDPTYGIFFYSQPDHDSNGHILSMKELFDDIQNDLFMFKVIDTPGVGIYNDDTRRFEISRVDEDFLEGLTDESFTDNYLDFFNTSFPIQFEYTEQTLSFPVEIDLTENDWLKIGEVDGSNQDMLSLTTVEETAGEVGTYRLLPYQFHTLFINTNSPGYVRITYFNTNESTPPLHLFPLKDIHLVCTSKDDYKIEFVVRLIEKDNGAFIVFTEKSTFLVDAIKAEWLGETIDIENLPQ
jgi:hypothetical protein